MKGFDEIAADAFQRSDDGKWIFFPVPRLLGGYEVPSEERKLELQDLTAQFLETTLWLSLAVMFVSASLGRILIGSLAMEAAIIAAGVNFVQRTTRFLVKSTVAYDSSQRTAASVRSRNVQRLAAITAGSIVATFVAGYLVQLQPHLLEPVLSVSAFVGLTTLLWTRLTKDKLEIREVRTQIDQKAA